MHTAETVYDADLETLLTPVVPTPVPIRWPGNPPDHHRLGPLERYKPVARLGQGGMAEIFLAAWEVAPNTHRAIVLKRLHSQFSEDPRLVQMFLDEARLVCQLAHPNIVKALEVGMLDDRYCIAMEYLEGQSLARLLERAYARGLLRVELAVHITIAVLDALHYAHEARDADGQPLGVIHRDISPQNIFVCNDGTVKVLDFGIAKTAMQEGQTAAGVVKGKVAYMAPEQAGTRPVDRRADVWSVGVVMWEALTGRRMFQAETDAATLNLTLNAQFIPAGKYRTDVPTELDAILSLALQSTPRLRYPTAAMMRRHLETWLDKRNYQGTSDLSATMHELFATEIGEQRRLLAELMVPNQAQKRRSRDSGPPSSIGGVVVTSPASLSAEQLSQMTNHVEQLTRQNRLVVRSLFGVVGVAVAAAALLVYFGMERQQSVPIVPMVSAPASRPATETAAAPPSAETKVQELTVPALPTPVDVAPLAEPQPQDDSTPLGSKTRAAALPALAASPKSRPKEDAKSASAQAILALPRVSGNDLGFLTIDSVPWSIVSVDGKQVGQTPLVGVKLRRGSHAVTLHNPELGVRAQHVVTIETGKTLVKRVGLE